MNDKERILTVILDRLSLTQTLCLSGTSEKMFDDRDGRQYAHFGAYDDRPIQKGDLVLASTGGISEWKIGWVHQVIDRDTIVMREIGGERLCNYGNERFQRIVGIDESLLLEGDRYQFQQKVLRAFRKGDEYMYRFGGVTFLDDGQAEIWTREAFGGFTPHNPSKPYSFFMKWNKRTSVKRILATMRENGYGTRKFDRNPEPTKELENTSPTGQNGA